jgi:hypothetical protein
MDKPMLFECFTDIRDDVSALEAMRNVDSSIVAAVASKVLPQGVKSAIKTLMRAGG